VSLKFKSDVYLGATGPKSLYRYDNTVKSAWILLLMIYLCSFQMVKPLRVTVIKKLKKKVKSNYFTVRPKV